MAEQTLTSRDWLTAIEGKAGASKTTTIGAIREVVEQRGYTVHGFGPTTGSVRALAEAGVAASTVASLTARTLEAGQGKGAVWIVDESSLLSTRQANGVLHHARTAQVERVIFVGDQRQHGAVEAGRPIAQMQAAGMLTARLETIRRQRDPAFRQVVELTANGQTREAVQQLDVQGRIVTIAESGERYAAIAREYARSVEAGQNVLVVSPANAERTALNAVIRAELVERGLVDREGQAHSVLVPRNITRAERGYVGSYEIGDVVRYVRGHRSIGAQAGAYATVTAIDREQQLVTVRTAQGEEHTYAPQNVRSVELYREEQRTFAQGERIQFRAPFKEQHIANGALGTIQQLETDSGQVTITMDTGKRFSTALASLQHIEYGYATTSHSSQGATVERVLVHVDTERSGELVNRQQFYVSLSRARTDAQVFTNDREQLSRVVSREVQKSMALDAVRESQRNQDQSQRPEQGKRPTREQVTRREIPPVQRHEWRHERVGGIALSVTEPTEWRHDMVLQRAREAEQAKAQELTRKRQHDRQREQDEHRKGHEYSRGLGRGR